jgi:cyclic pyranopterin monophosphate synthase
VSEFTHLDEHGAARMVDVSGKDVSARTATARGRVLVSDEVLRLLRDNALPKGDALAVARIAGIMAAKRTGVEMEALTSVTVACLALFDMVKAVDPAAVIGDIRVEEKTGGKTGHWTRP